MRNWGISSPGEFIDTGPVGHPGHSWAFQAEQPAFIPALHHADTFVYPVNTFIIWTLCMITTRLKIHKQVHCSVALKVYWRHNCRCWLACDAIFNQFQSVSSVCPEQWWWGITQCKFGLGSLCGSLFKYCGNAGVGFSVVCEYCTAYIYIYCGAQKGFRLTLLLRMG